MFIGTSSLIMPSCFYKLCFLLFVGLTCMISSFSNGASYEDFCSSIISESNVTSYTCNASLSKFDTDYFTGGDKLLLSKKPSDENQSCYDVGKSLKFPISSRFHETKTEGVYKIEAQLYIRSPYACFNNYPRNYTHRAGMRTGRRSSSVNASLTGFWSENTKMLCMVGSATWEYEQDQSVNLDVVLKMKYPFQNSTIQTSFVAGTFESAVGSKYDLEYFEPVSIFHFPALPSYEYSLVAKGAEFSDFVPKNQSLRLQRGEFCYMFGRSPSLYELWYAPDCSNKTLNCSPLPGTDNFMPPYLELNPIQCLEMGRKARYMIMFRNTSTQGTTEAFGLNSMLIGEAAWDESSNQLIIVACRILNLVNNSTNVVGDCKTRLSLRFPSVWNIRDVSKITGDVWTNKTVNDLGYFQRIDLKSFRGNGVIISQGLRYEYTAMDRVRQVCKLENTVKKGKHEYPNAFSYDMKFDMSFKNSQGRNYAFGGATPLSVGDKLYQQGHGLVAAEAKGKTDSNSPTSISYSIKITPFPRVRGGNGFPMVNWSVNVHGRMNVIAEGLYDHRTGHLCMVGCRKVVQFATKSRNDSTDCAIEVRFQFASLSDIKGGIIKGTIQSARTKTDPLYFDELALSSAASYTRVEKRSIQRMDFEIAMVLVSDTFLCIFIALQLLHLKGNPEVFSGISVLMLVILSLGHMIPLVLNFEAVFLSNGGSAQRRLWVSTWGWVEANEVAIRVIKMVVFLLQIRLLQLVWTEKANEANADTRPWLGEKRTLTILLPMYVLGGMLTLIVNLIRTDIAHRPMINPRVNYSLWEGLQSYAGLMLDGFLLPQVMLNAFQDSIGKQICSPFYIGVTLVRLVPRAYDVYRGHNYPAMHVEGSYYYANPAADFYSTGWDIVIACGCIALATTVFAQQWLGGRCIFPRRFRQLQVVYKKVAAEEVSN